MLTTQQRRIVSRHVRALAGLLRLTHELDLTFNDYWYHTNAIKKAIYFIEKETNIVFVKNKNELHGYSGKGVLPIMNLRKYIKVDVAKE